MEDSGIKKGISNSTALGEAGSLFKYAREVAEMLPFGFSEILAIFELCFPKCVQLKTILKDSKRQCIKSVLRSSKLEPCIQQRVLLQDVSEFLQAKVLA